LFSTGHVSAFTLPSTAASASGNIEINARGGSRRAAPRSSGRRAAPSRPASRSAPKFRRSSSRGARTPTRSRSSRRGGAASQRSSPAAATASFTPQQRQTAALSALRSANPSSIGMNASDRRRNHLGKMTGYAASQQMAAADRSRLTPQLVQRFNDVSANTGVPAPVLAALASRETHIGGPGMLGADGMSRSKSNKGYGIMQVDQKAHPNTRYGVDSEQHITSAANIFTGSYDKVMQAHPDWNNQQQLQAAIAAYNKGSPSRNPARPDAGTTGGDYSADTMARAMWYQQNVFNQQ